MSNVDWKIEGTMDQARRDAIMRALDECGHSPAAAAQRLRIGRSSLYRLIKEFEIPMRPKRKVRDQVRTATHDKREKAPTDRRPSKVLFSQGKYYLVRE